MENKNKKEVIQFVHRVFNFLNSKPSTPIFNNSKKIITIKYKNDRNDDYELIKKDVKPCKKGVSFKESIAPYLDAGLGAEKSAERVKSQYQDKVVYGNAPKMEPLTQTINNMKSTIDRAKQELTERIKAKENELKALKQEMKGEIQNDK